MDQRYLTQNLLNTAQDAYCHNVALMEFAPFPSDIQSQPVTPCHQKCCDVFQADAALSSAQYADLQQALLDASSIAHWRATYKDTDIGSDFMDRFGCYCIVGENASFWSDTLRLFMVYMPSGFYYPWHQHPAEEMYMVVSGNAVFRRHGCPDETLCEGQTSFHQSNQPHAMETIADPVLCLVAWRNRFETPPVLT